MSDSVSASAISSFLVECPICRQKFDEDSRIPRRLSCCVQSVCQPCLQEAYSNRRQTLKCPKCDHQHHLSGGVKSLPKEPLILKILDHLRIQNGLRLPCTDCPDTNPAVARCADCGVCHCQECLKAHRRERSSRDHKIVTFEEMRGRPAENFRCLHQCSEHKQQLQFFCHTSNKIICVSCTVVDHKERKGHNVVRIDEAHLDKATSTDELLKKLEAGIANTTNTLACRKKQLENIKVSKLTAKAEVDKTFDELTEELQLRRAILLSDVEARYDDNMKLTEKAVESTTTSLTNMKSSVQYMTEMRFRADKIEDLQLMVSSTDSLTAMLEKSPHDTIIARTGISFAPANIKQLKSDIQASGLVRTVQFTPTPISGSCTDLIRESYNIVKLEPPMIPEVPDLEWDTSTSSDDISITGSVIFNIRPDPPPPDTGCRFRSQRIAMTSTALDTKRGEHIMYQLKANLSVKRLSLEDVVIFESALSGSIEDVQHGQTTGLSLRVITCPVHKPRICLCVNYDNTEYADVPILDNKVGSSVDLHLGFLVDSVGKIRVIDVAAVRLIATVRNIVFDKPLWVFMYADVPKDTYVQGELVTGTSLTTSTALKNLITSLCK